jgi:Peptidase family M23
MAQSGSGSQRGDLRFNAVLEDNVSPQVDKIATKMQQLGASKHEIKLFIRAQDEVTAKAQQIKQTLSNLPKDTKLNLSVMHQKAVEDIHKAHETLQKVASSKPIEIGMKVKSNVDEEIARIESHVTNARYRLQANVASLANAPVVGDIKRTASFAMENAGAAIGVPLAAGAAGAVLGAGAKSFQLQSQYEQDMVALRTSMKSATAAVAEMADVTKFARTTPFNQPDVLQTDITLRNYGIRPKGPIGVSTMGDIAAGTGEGLSRSTDAVLAAVTRGDYRSLRGMGINLDQQDFAPGGRFQGKSQQEAIKQLTQIQFGGATALYANTAKGLGSNIQDIANLQIMRPIGQVPFQQGKQLLQTANERLTGDSPEAIRTQAKLGEAVDKVVLATSKLASNLKTVKENFDTYLKQPLTEIITSLGHVAEMFSKTFGGITVSAVQIVADALVAILKPLSALAEKFPILIQGFAAMKALKFVGGPDAMAGPERAVSGLNPLGQNFGPTNFFGGLKDTVKEVPTLIVGGVILSLLNAHKASVALKDSFNQYGAAGSAAAEQLSNSFDSFGMGLDRSVVKLKDMAAEINNLLGTGTATAEQRQKFLKDVTPAALNAEDKGGLSKAYLDQIVLPQYKGGTGENGAADSKAMMEFLKSKEAELKGLFPNMTRDETKTKSDLVAKNYAAAEASLKARTTRGSASTSGLGGAAFAQQLLETLPKFENMPKDVATGKSLLGDVHSQLDVRNKLLEMSVNLTPDAVKKGAEYEKAQAAALAPPGRPTPGLTTAEATARFMKNMSATARPEQYLNTKFEDTPDALGRGSVLTAIKENQQTEEGRKKNITEQNRFVAGLLSGLGKYGEERLPQIQNQYFRNFGKNGSAQVNQQALQTPGGAASEFQRMTQLAQVDIPKAMETLQSQMGTTDLRMKQLTMSQGILDNAQQKYTYDTVVPAQRALEDYSRVMLQTSRAMEDSSFRSGKAQFSMSQYTDGLLKGTNALNDQSHSLDMYQKQLQYLQLQQHGMMQDLSQTTVTRGYSSVIKPLMGFGLQNAIDIADRRKQMIELQKDLRITDNGQMAGDVMYQMQKNMRTGFAGTEYGAKKALEATKTLSGVMTQEIFRQRDLQDTQHEQVKTMRNLDDAAFAAQRGLRAFQDRQEAMRRKVHETNVEMQQQEIQLAQLDLLQKTALQQANGLGLMTNAAIKNQGANSVDYFARIMGINTSMVTPGSATPPTFADKALQGIWDSLKVISWPLRKLVNPVSTITGLSSLSKNVLPDKNLLAGVGLGPLAVALTGGAAGFAGGGILGTATRYGSRGGLFGLPLETPPPGTDYRLGRAGLFERIANRAGAAYRATESGQALERSAIRGGARGGILGAFVGLGAGILAGGSAPDVAGVLGYLTALNAAGILAAKAVNRLIVPIAKLAVVTPFKITRALARDVGLYPQPEVPAVPNPEAGTALTKYDPEARDALKYNPKTGEAYMVAESNKWTEFQKRVQSKIEELSTQAGALKDEIKSGTLSAKESASKAADLSEVQFNKRALSANLNLSKMGKWFMQEPKYIDMVRPIQGTKATIGGIVGSLAGGALGSGLGPIGSLLGALLGGPIGNSLTRKLPSVLELGLRPLTPIATRIADRAIAGPLSQARESYSVARAGEIRAGVIDGAYRPISTEALARAGGWTAAEMANLGSRIGQTRFGMAAARGITAAGEAGMVELGGKSIKALLGTGGGLSGLLLPGLLLGFQQYGTSSSKQLAADAARMYKSGELSAAEWKRFNDRLNGAGAQYGKGAATVGTTDGQLNSVLDKALEKKLGDRTGKTLGLSALSAATLGITGLLGVGVTQTDKQQEAMAERLKKILAPPADALNEAYGKYGQGDQTRAKVNATKTPANFQSLQAMDTSLRGAKTQAGMGFGQSAQAVESRKQLQDKILRAEADLQAASQNGLNTAAKKQLQAFIDQNRRIYNETFNRSKEQLRLENLYGQGLENVKKGQNTKNTALVEDGYVKIKKATGLKLEDIRKLVAASGAKTGEQYAAAISGAFDAKMPQANQTALNAALKTLQANYKKQGGASFADMKAVGDTVGLNPDEIAKLVNGAKTGQSATARILAGIRAKEATNGLDYTQVKTNSSTANDPTATRLHAIEHASVAHITKMRALNNVWRDSDRASEKDYYDKRIDANITKLGLVEDAYTRHNTATNNIIKQGNAVLTKTSSTLFDTFTGQVDGFQSHYGISEGKAHGGLIKADPHKIGPGYPIRVAEEGHPEMIIPLAPHRRERAKSLIDQTKSMVGYANGGLAGFMNGGRTKAPSGIHFPLPYKAPLDSIDQGVDISAPGHTPLLAIAPGRIVQHGISGFGPDAPVLALDTKLGGYGSVYYGHAGPKNAVRVGTHVSAGQVISEVGAGIVGMSTGPHLEIGFTEAFGLPKGSAPAQYMNWLLGGAKGGTGFGASGASGSPATPAIPHFTLKAWKDLINGGVGGKAMNKVAKGLHKKWEDGINTWLKHGGKGANNASGKGLGKAEDIIATVFGSEGDFYDSYDAVDPATAAGIGYRGDNMRKLKWVYGEIGDNALGHKPRGYKYLISRGDKAAVLGKYDINNYNPGDGRKMDLWIHAARYLNNFQKTGMGHVQLHTVPQDTPLGPYRWGGWHAKGGNFRATGPTLFGVGEKGPERVSITPENKPLTASKSETLLQKLLEVASSFKSAYDASSARAAANNVRGVGTGASAAKSSGKAAPPSLTGAQQSTGDQFKASERAKMDLAGVDSTAGIIAKAKSTVKTKKDLLGLAKKKASAAISKATSKKSPGGKKITAAERKTINAAKKAAKAATTAYNKASSTLKQDSAFEGKTTTELGGIVARDKKTVTEAAKRVAALKKTKPSKKQKAALTAAKKAEAVARKALATPQNLLDTAETLFTTQAQGDNVDNSVITSLLKETNDPFAGGLQSDSDTLAMGGGTGQTPGLLQPGGAGGIGKGTSSKETPAQKTARLKREAKAKKLKDWKKKHPHKTPPKAMLSAHMSAALKGAKHVIKKATSSRVTHPSAALLTAAVAAGDVVDASEDVLGAAIDDPSADDTETYEGDDTGGEDMEAPDTVGEVPAPVARKATAAKKVVAKAVAARSVAAKHSSATSHKTVAQTPKKAAKSHGSEIVKAIKDMHQSVKQAPAPKVTVHTQAEGAKIKTKVTKPTTRGR